MQNLKCAEQETVYTQLVECQYCNRDYTVYEVSHHCHPLARCETPSRYYREEYLSTPKDTNVENPNKLVAACDACAEKKKRNRLQKNRCPACKYEGYYECGADKLCPGCKNATMTAPKFIPKPVSKQSLGSTTTLVAVKTPVKLYFEVDTVGDCPRNGACYKIIVNAATAESLASDDWFINKFEYPKTNDDDIKGGILDLEEWLMQLSQSHTFTWNETASLSWEWLKYLYNKHSLKKIPLI